MMDLEVKDTALMNVMNALSLVGMVLKISDA